MHDDAYILSHSLEPRFAAYLFSSPKFREQVEHVYSDTKVVRVSRDNLARLKVPVPPFEKQREIADAIDAVDRQIASITGEIDSARIGRAALLDALLSRKIQIPLAGAEDLWARSWVDASG
ncbi:restriction endonuclease subunit S [Pseudoclavibacter helvolus]|uniref:restriction endonuclease subunit S n=1 Tax=Pseudoclavibacter helvolus TaxID=255205 RepID=UPI0024AD1031|nr:restriction endonuclease subunit S [Pseudoclavibacter helvolus]